MKTVLKYKFFVLAIFAFAAAFTTFSMNNLNLATFALNDIVEDVSLVKVNNGEVDFNNVSENEFFDETKSRYFVKIHWDTKNTLKNLTPNEPINIYVNGLILEDSTKKHPVYLENDNKTQIGEISVKSNYIILTFNDLVQKNEYKKFDILAGDIYARATVDLKKFTNTNYAHNNEISTINWMSEVYGSNYKIKDLPILLPNNSYMNDKEFSVEFYINDVLKKQVALKHKMLNTKIDLKFKSAFLNELLPEENIDASLTITPEENYKLKNFDLKMVYNDYSLEMFKKAHKENGEYIKSEMPVFDGVTLDEKDMIFKRDTELSKYPIKKSPELQSLVGKQYIDAVRNCYGVYNFKINNLKPFSKPTELKFNVTLDGDKIPNAFSGYNFNIYTVITPEYENNLDNQIFSVSKSFDKFEEKNFDFQAPLEASTMDLTKEETEKTEVKGVSQTEVKEVFSSNPISEKRVNPKTIDNLIFVKIALAVTATIIFAVLFKIKSNIFKKAK